MTKKMAAVKNPALQASAELPSLLQETEQAFALASRGALPVIDLFNTTKRLADASHLDIAIQLYRTWLERTDSPIAYAVYFNLAVMLGNANDDQGAEAAYRTAIEQAPTFTESYINLGILLERTNRQDEALAVWRAVIASVNSDESAARGFYLQALNNLGRLLELCGELPEAEAMLARSLEEDPKQISVMQHWIDLRQKLCEWPVYRRADGIAAQDLSAATSALAMLSATDDPALQLEAARRYVTGNVLTDVAHYMSSRQSYGHERLRIGYLSSNFGTHAVSMQAAELYGLHDRSKFEVYGFCSIHEDGSPLRARAIAGMDHFIEIDALGDKEAASLIRSHEIDILVNLQGLSLGARHNILSYRPAPVQIVWLGFSGPTALPEIDYVLCDPFVFPPELEPFFTEKPLRMPHSFQINDRQRIVGQRPSRESCGLPEDAFVFCSFNSNFKFTPELFGAWMRILKRVPSSVLWLVADHEAVRENLCKAAKKFGIARKRLHFTTRLTLANDLARYQVADLFLDTFPFAASTTASNALWAGLPLLTCVGRTFASRVAGSLLLAADLPELITNTLQDYEDRAVFLAKNPKSLSSMRQRFTDKRLNCTLFDSPRFVRDFEDVLQQVAFKGGAIQPIKEVSTLPLVSILIPTHNRPDYFEIALKSALEQSYENIEIIVSDNGDDALTEQRIKPYLVVHPHVTYYRKQGMTAIENFRKCVELSKGEYINYLMDDDVFHPEKIKRMMHYYLNYPNTGLVTSFRQLIDEHGQYLPPRPGTERMFPTDTTITGQSLGDRILSMGSNLIGEPTTVLIRRSDHGDVFGTFAGQQYVVLSDVATWLSILATRNCVYISDPLSYFRMHGGQDQVGSTMKIKASMEWFRLFFDAHKNRLFLKDRTQFLGLLAGKVAGFTSYIAANHAEIRSCNYQFDEIYSIIQQAYEILLED